MTLCMPRFVRIQCISLSLVCLVVLFGFVTRAFASDFVLRVAACVYTVAAHDFLRKPVLETLHKHAKLGSCKFK